MPHARHLHLLLASLLMATGCYAEQSQSLFEDDSLERERLAVQTWHMAPQTSFSLGATVASASRCGISQDQLAGIGASMKQLQRLGGAQYQEATAAWFAKGLHSVKPRLDPATCQLVQTLLEGEGGERGLDAEAALEAHGLSQVLDSLESSGFLPRWKLQSEGLVGSP